VTRRKFIAGNWKMHKTTTEAVQYVTELTPLLSGRSGAEACLCVPFIHIGAVYGVLRDTSVKLGAQNVHYEDEGAFTGEISCRMLAGAGVKYVIIGHSERRAYFSETDDIINLKLRAAFNAQLCPILCVGENLEQRDSGAALDVVLNQLVTALQGVNTTSMQKLTVAYEPVWAIGTGRTALPGQVREMCQYMRAKVEEMYDGRAASKMRCIYGGSINPVTAREIVGNEDVDGALVGGASLKPAVFADIIKSV
jgi:triosephosphate isomerase